jgi:group I intron endonuclease
VKTCGVYAITNTVTGKSYVGSSVNVEARLNRHFSELGRGTHYNGKLQSSFNKHGVDVFKAEVLGLCGRSRDDRQELEQLWIDLLMSADRGYNICVKAMTVAGTSQSPEHIAKRAAARKGAKHSAETRAKLSELAKARSMAHLQTPAVRAKAGAAIRGNRHSDETRAKLSEVAKARPPMSAETRRKIGEASKRTRAEKFWNREGLQ